jgi:hypothetical protein
MITGIFLIVEYLSVFGEDVEPVTYLVGSLVSSIKGLYIASINASFSQKIFLNTCVL